MHDFIRTHEGALLSGQDDLFLACAASVPTPRLSATVQGDAGVEDLRRMDELYPANAAVALFSSIRQALAQKTEPPALGNLSRGRACKYHAYVLESLGRHGEALGLYREIDGFAGADPLLNADATIGI